MIEELRNHFSAVVIAYPWVASLANILPLSALVDFLDVPRTLHIFQLSHNVPLWCWTVTPYGCRFLFSESTAVPTDQCCLDEFGRTPGLMCIDGRYGDCYPAMSPETLRMCINTATPIPIKNSHENMKRGDIRPHTLDIIHVQRQRPTTIDAQRRPLSLLWASTLGWLVLGGLLTTCVLMWCWWAFSFLAIVPLTGFLISHVQISGPRRLRHTCSEHGDYNRLILVAKHMNETHWFVFYGESSTVNSLLNWPLQKTTSPGAARPHIRRGLQMILRLIIFSQWVLAVTAASLSGLDAYIISLWVLVCILSQTTLFSGPQTMPDWMRRFAHISMTRYQTQLSSRRALLNTVLALNPDKLPQSLTFDGQVESSNEGLAWVDHILKGGADRVRWIQSTQIAMQEWQQLRALPAWRQQYSFDNATKTYPYYWVPFIEEGIEVGARIIDYAGLTGRVGSKTV